jgi:sortase B
MHRTNKDITRLFAAAFAFFVILFAGCAKKEPALPSASSPPASSSSGPSSSSIPATIVEEDEIRDLVFLAEEIDKGLQRNGDTVGWVYIPGTTINDAVLQKNDPKATHAENNNYYLRLDEDKKYSVFGCYWADPDSFMGGRDELSRNTIIYGHADLKDNPEGKKFSQLFKYMDSEFLAENPYIYFSTASEDMVWQVFSVFFTNWKDYNYIQGNPSDEEYEMIIREAKLRSEYLIDVSVGLDDKIITLSTCTAYYNKTNPDDYRYVVMAKLLPGTRISADSVPVSKNPNPKKS